MSVCENYFAMEVNLLISCLAMQAIPNYNIDKSDYWVVIGEGDEGNNFDG